MSGSGTPSGSGSGSGSGLGSDVQFHQYDPNEGDQRRKRKPPDAGRPFQCDLCPKSFDRPSTLAQHMLSHSGERPHICPFCEMSFTVASNLYRHMRGCPSKPPNVDVENDYYIPSRNSTNHFSRNQPRPTTHTPPGGGTLVSLDGPQSSPTADGENSSDPALRTRGRGPGRPRGSKRGQVRGNQSTTSKVESEVSASTLASASTSKAAAPNTTSASGPTARALRAARRGAAAVVDGDSETSTFPESTQAHQRSPRTVQGTGSPHTSSPSPSTPTAGTSAQKLDTSGAMSGTGSWREEGDDGVEGREDPESEDGIFEADEEWLDELEQDQGEENEQEDELEHDNELAS